MLNMLVQGGSVYHISMETSDTDYEVVINQTVNKTMFVTEKDDDTQDLDLIIVILTSLILGLMILTTVIGNVFVMAAILLDRHLQSVANYLILSLAVADLLVAILVMPLGAVYEISKKWILGPNLCDMWTSSDVLCCTASILHLLAIALDRYWAVTHPHYIHSRSSTTIWVLISLVWIMSIVVSLAPLFGWKDDNWSERVENGHCIVSQDISYQIFATSATFFVPLILILLLYWRIFLTARTRLRNRLAQKTRLPQASVIQTATLAASFKSKDVKVTKNDNGNVKTTSFSDSEKILKSDTTSLCHQENKLITEINGQPKDEVDESPSSQSGEFQSTPRINSCPRHKNGAIRHSSMGCQTDDLAPLATPKDRRKPKKEKKHISLEAKREKKAAKTLAIVTGAFIICWLPFFVIALVNPLCENCINNYVSSFFLWLGYFNSTLNPIIYTVFSPEFRQAFKKILCGRASPSNYRPRHLQ